MKRAQVDGSAYHRGVRDVVVFRAPAPLDREEIRRRVAPLLAEHGVSEAWLIGSYARGDADAWSDVDLVVVMASSAAFPDRPLALADVLDALSAGVDMLVYTPEEFAHGMAEGRDIFHAVRMEGVKLL